MQTQTRFWSPTIPKVTIGLDLGDRRTELCQLNELGAVVEQSSLPTSRAGIEKRFRDLEPARIVLEAGTHSPWISRMLAALGHEVIVANPAKLYGGKRTSRRKKNDRIDAEYLARQGRADPALLFPIQHRSEDTQGDLALIHSRDALVRSRASLVNHVRGTVKSVGGRLPASSTPSFARTAAAQIPQVLRPALLPVLEMIQTLSAQIAAFDKQTLVHGGGETPRHPIAAAGHRSRSTHRADLRAGAGRSGSIPTKPLGGQLSGTRTTAERDRRCWPGSRAFHQQDRGCAPAQTPGQQCALHSGTLWS